MRSFAPTRNSSLTERSLGNTDDLPRLLFDTPLSGTHSSTRALERDLACLRSLLLAGCFLFLFVRLRWRFLFLLLLLFFIRHEICPAFQNILICVDCGEYSRTAQRDPSMHFPGRARDRSFLPDLTQTRDEYSGQRTLAAQFRDLLVWQ